jgi:hypothetical protein
VNYYNTLIEVADDCPVSEAQAPQARGGKKTKPALEYELLAGHPYTYREEDIGEPRRRRQWPTSFALTELTATEEAKIGALVKKAVS